MTILNSGLLIGIYLCSSTLFAQTVDKDKDSDKAIAVIEIGAAVDRSLEGDGTTSGPSIAAEVEPIENWLEIEAGVSPLFRLEELVNVSNLANETGSR